jgi:predicted lipoprotein with Yx(FWY)xxD motif
MAPSRRQLLSAAASGVLLGIAGCAGDDSTGDSGGTTTGAPTTTAEMTTVRSTTDTEATTTAQDTTDATTAAETTDEGTAASVALRSEDDLGQILVDGEGMTLYMFDSDEQGSGSSTWTGGADSAWPPLTTESAPDRGENVTAELTTFERESGETQVAANGWPLYYYAGDGEPGDTSGQGGNDVWWVLGPDGVPMRNSGGSQTTTEGGGGGGIY